MTNAIGYLCHTITAGIDYIIACLPAPPNVMIELPPFGANELKLHFGLDVEAPPVPDYIQDAWEKPCPCWHGKLIKETNLMCLIPDLQTLERLFSSLDCKSIFKEYKATFPKPGPYWILITKESIPGTRFASFERQKEKIVECGYDAPYLIEVAMAVLAANKVGNVHIFPGDGLTTIYESNFTICHEVYDGIFSSDHIAAGSYSRDISVKENASGWSGVAGVIR